MSTKTVHYECKLCRMKNKGFGDIDGFLIAEILMATKPMSLRAAEKAIFEIYHVHVSYESIREHLPHLINTRTDMPKSNPVDILKACGRKDTDFGAFDTAIHEALKKPDKEPETTEERIEKFQDQWNKEEEEVDLGWRKKTKGKRKPDFSNWDEEED